MIIEDEIGQWEEEGNLRILIKPSEKITNQPPAPITREDILNELTQLDIIVSRDREAVYEAGVDIFMTEAQLKAIEKKKELRLQLDLLV